MGRVRGRGRAGGVVALLAACASDTPATQAPTAGVLRNLARGGARVDVASLPLYGSGLYPIGIQAHASTAAHPDQQRHEDAAAAELRRPARGLLSPMPFLVADEEMSFGWPGSFRPAAVAAAAAPPGSAALNSAGGVAVHAREEPDLTLRL